jgi:fructosamine-3-kinase
MPLLERAAGHGRLETRERALLETVVDSLPSLVGPPETPARLHGDLWSGNLVFDSEGGWWLIDPAVYGGHREIDLAMLKLFGGFPSRVFDAYEESFPLSAGAGERVPLYQIYPLLVHLCLFGRSYASRLMEAAESALHSARHTR